MGMDDNALVLSAFAPPLAPFIIADSAVNKGKLTKKANKAISHVGSSIGHETTRTLENVKGAMFPSIPDVEPLPEVTDPDTEPDDSLINAQRKSLRAKRAGHGTLRLDLSRNPGVSTRTSTTGLRIPE